MRAILPFVLLAGPALADDGAGTALPVRAEAGMTLFGETCIDTLPDFEGAGAALIAADAVKKVEGSTTWLGVERALSFAVPTAEDRPFCSFIFLSADDAAITEAARDDYFGDGERNALDASRRHTTLFDDALVDFITLVDDKGARGVFVRLQAYPVPPKGDADNPVED